MGTIIDGNRVVFLYGCSPDSMVEDRCSVYTEWGLQSHPAGEEDGDDA